MEYDIYIKQIHSSVSIWTTSVLNSPEADLPDFPSLGWSALICRWAALLTWKLQSSG